MNQQDINQIAQITEDAARILSRAGLHEFDIELYGLSEKLDTFSLCIGILIRNGQLHAAQSIIKSNGFNDVISEVRFVFDKIGEDEDFKRLLHDRIVQINGHVDYFDENNRNRRTSNIVDEINRLNFDFRSASLGVSDIAPETQPLPGQRVFRPAAEIFRHTSENLQNLKARLAMPRAC